MWIFYLEALLVLAIGFFIVWWTMPKKKPPAQPAQETVRPMETASANDELSGEARAQRTSGSTAGKD